MARAKWNTFPHLPAAQLADNDKIPVSDESQAPGDKDATTTIGAIREAIGGVDHVSGPSSAAVGQLAVFADTTGKAITDGDPALTADNVLHLVEAHPSQTTNPPGGITEQDIISLFRPDNPNDRTEGGKDYGILFSALTAAVLSNITVIQNANGVSFRFPQAQIQVCFHRLQAVYFSGSYLRIDDWEYPQPFSDVPEPFLQMNNHGSNYTPSPNALRPPIVWNGESAARMGNARIYADGGGFQNGDTIRVSAVAIGFYS